MGSYIYTIYPNFGLTQLDPLICPKIAATILSSQALAVA